MSGLHENEYRDLLKETIVGIVVDWEMLSKEKRIRTLFVEAL